MDSVVGMQVVLTLFVIADAREQENRFSGVKFIASLAIAVTVMAMSVVTAWIICDLIHRRSNPR